MFLAPFIYLLSVLFLILWISDAVLTFKCVSKKGISTELNPIIKFIFETRKNFFLIFKTLETIVFLVLVFWLVSFDSQLALNILFGLILLYGLITTQALIVYAKTNNDLLPAIILFLILILFCLLLIQQVVANFSNSVELSKALKDCLLK